VGRPLPGIVRNGGGLYIILTPECSPVRVNEVFAPFLAGAQIGQTEQPETAPVVDLSEASVTDPLFLPLLREEWGTVSDLWVSQYFGVRAPGDCATALRLTTGEPVMLLSRLGRGQCCLQLFPCGLDASSLARSPVFVPMVQELLTELATRDAEADDPAPAIRVGDVLTLPTPELRGLPGPAKLSGPTEHEFPLSGPQTDAILVSGLQLAGAYRVWHPAKNTSRRRWLGVNPVAEESVIVPLTEPEQTAVFGSGGSRRIEVADLGSEFGNRRELLPLLMTLVFVALIAEALAGAWFSRRQQQTTDNPNAADANDNRTQRQPEQGDPVI